MTKPLDSSCLTSTSLPVLPIAALSSLLPRCLSESASTHSMPLLPRGYDRCRHFVITQNQDGQFVIAGDYQTYASLTELIEHYKASPIQPFGEYLTSSCHQVSCRCDCKFELCSKQIQQLTSLQAFSIM